MARDKQRLIRLEAAQAPLLDAWMPRARKLLAAQGVKHVTPGRAVGLAVYLAIQATQPIAGRLEGKEVLPPDRAEGNVAPGEPLVAREEEGT